MLQKNQLISLKKLLPYLLITLITILGWYKLLNQAPGGEGYYYFDPGQNLITSKGLVSDLWGLDNFAKLTFDITPIFFNDNLSLYFTYQLIFMILLHLTIFYIVSFLTKNKWVGFFASAFFALSYIANFEMLGSGNYQRFVQRIPNLIPALFAIKELDLFIVTKKIKHYFYMIGLFTIAMTMAHFSSFLLSFLVIYALIKSFNLKLGLRQLSYPFLSILSLTVINTFLISHDSHTPHGNILAFINHVGINNVIQKILIQLVSLNVPPFFLEKIKIITNPFTSSVTLLSIPIIIIYLIGLIFIKKRYPNFFVLYTSSVLVIPILLFLNLYLDKVNPIYNIQGFNYYFLPSDFPNIETFTHSVKGDRYYYVPFIFVGIIWSTILWVLLARKKESLNLSKYKNLYKSRYLIISGIIFLVFAVYNLNLIWRDFDTLQFNSNLMKNYISYIKSISPNFKEDTVILTSRPLIWPGSMIKAIYGPPSLKFISFDDIKRDKLKLSKYKSLYVIDYDPQTWQVKDITTDYLKKNSN